MMTTTTPDSLSSYAHGSSADLLAGPSLLKDAESVLETLKQREVQCIRETEELFKKQTMFVDQSDKLREHIHSLRQTNVASVKLASVIDSSSVLVDEVCQKFSSIDLAKTRLDDCLSKIEDILDLKLCRDGVISALGSNNYEEAATHVMRFLAINLTELQKTVQIIQKHRREALMTADENSENLNHLKYFDDNNSLDLESTTRTLKELQTARDQLSLLCQKNMDIAIKEENAKDIERYFKILPMLNEHQTGLKKYAEYLRTKIANPQIDELLDSENMTHADKLRTVFQTVAKLVDVHQPLVETYYGPGHLIVIIKEMQKECDRLSRKVLEQFRNETNLQYIAKVVRSSTLHMPNPTLSNSQNSNLNLSLSKIDPRNVDKMLNEISMIVSSSEVYLNFIVQRIRDDSSIKTESETQKKAAQLELYNMIFIECELNHLVQEVGGIYVMLEQYYLNESSKKAILMDQIDVDPAHSCLVSSMLDDIFFILKKCIKRSVVTSSNEVFCAIINHCVTLLESVFCKYLEDKLKSQQYYSAFSTKNLDFSQAYSAIQSGRYLQSVNEQEKSNAQYFSALNNLDKACDYITNLKLKLEGDIKRLRSSLRIDDAQNNENQLKKSMTCLNELAQLVPRFSQIIKSSLHQLFNLSLKGRVRSELKTVIEDNPDLTSIVSSDSSALTSLAQNLLKTSDNHLEQSLMPENYARLVDITRAFLASSLKVIN